jgi:hypothetical protein
MEKMQRYQVLQGNLLLTPMPAIPAAAQDVTGNRTANGRVTLSHGESGGRHEFSSAHVRVWEDGDETYIEVLGDQPRALEHTTPRHDTVPVAPGIYRMTDQREAPAPLSPRTEPRHAPD